MLKPETNKIDSNFSFFKFLTFAFLGLVIIQPAKLFAQTENVTDIDGNLYKTVKIGEQLWMAENLRVTRYNNGDSIPFLISADDWSATSSSAFAFYDNDTNNISQFGILYNWFTVDDKREICPNGWHVPSDTEWIMMEKALGMKSQETGKMTAWRGTDEGNKLKTTEFGGNNLSGFSAKGTGYRHPNGEYKGKGADNDYWTSTLYINKGKSEGMLHGLLNSKSTIVRNFHTPDYGFCIRCLKN